METGVSYTPKIRTVLSTLAIAVLVASARPTSAEEQSARDAISGCRQELQSQMSREVGGRQPDASIDERRAQVTRLSNAETRVRGNGRYRRENNDRGRDFTFDCTYNSRNNSARATYNWSGSGGGQAPGPGIGRPPSGGAVPNGRIFFSGGIVGRGSNLCLDVEGASNRNQANVQQWTCSGGTNQLWDVIDLGGGDYAIINQQSNSALTVGGGSGDGANVAQSRWSGGRNQRWRLEKAGNAYRIISRATNTCLDVEGARRESGANMQTWSCSGGANQAWLLRR